MSTPALRGPRNLSGGFTLLEVILAFAILGFITTILWGTFSQTAAIKKRTEATQERAHAARVALMRLSRELEMAFLSDSENPFSTERRTMFIATSHRDIDEIRFSWFGRQRLRGDIPEADSSVVMYYAEPDPVDRSVLNLMRRETRRLEAVDPRSLLGESYVLCPGISRLKFSFSRLQEGKGRLARGLDHGGRRWAAIPAHPRSHRAHHLRRDAVRKRPSPARPAS